MFNLTVVLSRHRLYLIQSKLKIIAKSQFVDDFCDDAPHFHRFGVDGYVCIAVEVFSSLV